MALHRAWGWRSTPRCDDLFNVVLEGLRLVSKRWKVHLRMNARAFSSPAFMRGVTDYTCLMLYDRA